MKPAVFLDRDGTLMHLVHHLTDPADVRLIPGAGHAIAALRAAGFAVVMVTNQSVIGRGKLAEDGLMQIHAEMNRQLAVEAPDAELDAIYFCPLAPTQKDPTVIEDPMRKPGPGMLMAAARDLTLDLAQSWMIGDTVSDMLAGRNAGCRTILVRTGYGNRFAHARDCVTHAVKDIAEATQVILSVQPKREYL